MWNFYKTSVGISKNTKPVCGKQTWLLVVEFSLCLLALSLLSCCDDYPRDTRNTLANVQATKVLRVGLIQHAPWAYKVGDNVRGIDVDIIKSFCKTLNVEPSWQFFSESQAFEQLKNYQLDIVIGGLSDENPYKQDVAFIRPYIVQQEPEEKRYVMALAKGENAFMITLERFLKLQTASINQQRQDS